MSKENKPILVHGGLPTKIGGALIDSTSLDPDAVVEHAKKVSEVISRLSSYALSLTESRHWTNYKETNGPGKPWLNGPGAELMVTHLGLQVEYDGDGYKIDNFEFEVNGKKVTKLMMTCFLRVSLGNWSSICAEGHCVTDDAFFSRGGRLGADKVDLGNVKQSAYTNALSNAVTRLLGIRNLSWDQVKALTKGGVGPDSVGAATYKSGGKGGASRGRRKTMATDAHRSRIWNEWCEYYSIDKDSIPEGTGKVFYDWAEHTLKSKEARDKTKWTEADAKKLLDELEKLRSEAIPMPVSE